MRRSFPSWLVLALAAGAAAMAPLPLRAHELQPGFLELRETAPGPYDVLWKLPFVGAARMPMFLGPEVVRTWRGDTSFTIRHPWVVAFAFGLLHGFGLASGLTQLGLPKSEVPLAMLLFNHRQSMDKVVDFLEGRWPDTALNADVERRVRARVPAFARR